MVKRIISFNVFLLVCIVFTVQAENLQTKIRSEVGIQTYYHSYKEPGVMENEGAFIGLSYSFLHDDQMVFGVEGLLAYGQVDYTSESTGETDDIDDICLETRLILGYNISNTAMTKITPYTGIAHRYLQDDSSNRLTSTGNIGYLRESNYYYTPLGIMIDSDLGNGWHMQPRVEYDFFWAGTQRSEMGYISGYEDIENDQEEGYGYRMSLAFKKQGFASNYSIEIFYRFWDIEDSEVTYDSASRGWIEPDNETSEFGVNFSVSF